MAHENLTALDILDLVGELPAVTKAYQESDGEIGFVVYDAFSIRGIFDDYGRGNWGFSIVIGPKTALSHVLGRRLSLRSTRDEVREALETIDWYARLRLGPEYLEAYAAAYSQG